MMIIEKIQIEADSGIQKMALHIRSKEGLSPPFCFQLPQDTVPVVSV